MKTFWKGKNMIMRTCLRIRTQIPLGKAFCTAQFTLSLPFFPGITSHTNCWEGTLISRSESGAGGWVGGRGGVCVHARARSVAQLCPLCGSVDCSWPGSSVHGIVQARIPEGIAIPASRGSSWPRDWTHVSCIGRWILHFCTTWEAPILEINPPKIATLSQSTDSFYSGDSVECEHSRRWWGCGERLH